MKIFNLSAECYPAAKVGGLADVVGALPKYLQQLGAEASVILPKYSTNWITGQEFEVVYQGQLHMDWRTISFAVQKEKNQRLGFPFYVIDIPQYFDRPGIYGDPGAEWGYFDEAERFISYQIAALTWIKTLNEQPDIIHCHDHHTALIPFMMTQCNLFESLASIPTVLTVHNAEYQGRYPHVVEAFLPNFEDDKKGLLDWKWQLNSLAAGLKCCWQITTVSPSYMKDLCYGSNGLEFLFAREKEKSRGILNGIDDSVWNPKTDRYLNHHYSVKSLTEGKTANKNELCRQFGFKPEAPLISFIGRLVDEKGADLLPSVFSSILESTMDVNCLVLGTGQPQLHNQFREMSEHFGRFFSASLSYDEQLAHQIYAGSDFMIMPSRVEPCGLNQMYAMRYGTILVARNVGGLKDTIRDISKPDGYGITFDQFTHGAAHNALLRALELFHTKQTFCEIRKKIMKLDFSWNVSAKRYIDMYKDMLQN